MTGQSSIDLSGHLHEAVALHRSGRADEAVRLYGALLADRPAEGMVLRLLGLAVQETGDTGRAALWLGRAAAAAPTDAETRYSFARHLMARGRHAEAAAEFQTALDHGLKWGPAADDLAYCLIQEGAFAAAARVLSRSVSAGTASPSSYGILAASLRSIFFESFAIDELHRARAAAERGVALAPDNAGVVFNLALAFHDLGEHAGAVACCERSLRLGPDNADTHYIAGLSLLSLGGLPRGWEELERRRTGAARALVERGIPAWDGRPCPGRDLVLIAEGGLGDTIQFVRYAIPAAERCRTLYLTCQPELERLLRTLDLPNIVFNRPLGGTAGLPAAAASLLSLPHIFGSTHDTIPAPVPYLAADPQRVEFWRGRLAGVPGLRVAICWHNTGPGRPPDRRRSLPEALVRDLARLPGVSLIGLHRDPAAPRRHPYRDGDTNLIHLGAAFDEGPDAFLDSAAAMKAVDLVVSVDTAVAHLAGALGVPVWVPLARRADWRWMNDEELTPWYPTMRLFRQDRFMEWEPVVARLAAALVRRAAEAGFR